MLTQNRLFRSAFGAVVLALVLNATAIADMGQLAEFLDTGFSDGWDARLESGSYWLDNRQEPGAIRYYYGSYDPSSDGKRTIQVDVKIDTDDPQSKAGLLYGFDAETRNYFMILLGSDGQLDLVRRDSSGFHTSMSSSTDAGPGRFNRITLRENGNEIAISVNDRELGAIGNSDIGKGAAGIVAIGLGQFGFRGYQESSSGLSGALYPSPATAAANAKAKANSSPQLTGRRLAAADTASPDVAAAGTAGGTQVHVIRDEFGFEQPMDALSLETPAGWTVQGAVQWHGRPSCGFEPSKTHFMATSPDGRQWVELIPGGVWGWSSQFDNMPELAKQGFAGCDARPITDIGTFANQYIPTIRPGSEITAMRMRPDLADKTMQIAQKDMKLEAGQRPRIEVMEVRVSYEAEGNTVNEMLLPSVLFIDQAAPDLYGQMTGYVTVGMAVGTISTATVNGPVDEGLLDLIGDGMTQDPAYTARLKRHYQEKGQLMKAAHARKMAANRAYLASRRSTQSSWKVDTTGSDILDIQMGTYKSTTAMKDAGHARSVDMIHERKPWLNSEGKTIYMPQQYQRAYQLPNSVYAGTNDAFFNPVQTFGEFASPMQPAGY